MRGEGSPMLNLQARLRGTRFRDLGQSVPCLESFDRRHLAARPFQPRLDSRIENYELAARMQLTATDALDVAGESEATKALYGIGEKDDRQFWKTLPPGAASRGTRGPLYPAVSAWPDVGQSRKYSQFSTGGLPAYRSAGGRVASRFAPARIARFHACFVGRRIWTASHGPGS